MNLEISQAQFGVRPPVTKPIPEFLLEVGEKGLRELIPKHYDLIQTEGHLKWSVVMLLMQKHVKHAYFTLFFHPFHSKPSTFLSLKQACKIVA